MKPFTQFSQFENERTFQKKHIGNSARSLSNLAFDIFSISISNLEYSLVSIFRPETILRMFGLILAYYMIFKELD